MKVIDVTPASVEDLCKFHSPLYIEFLKKISYYFTNVPKEDRDVVAEELEAESQDFGIGLFFCQEYRSIKHQSINVCMTDDFFHRI